MGCPRQDQIPQKSERRVLGRRDNVLKYIDYPTPLQKPSLLGSQISSGYS
jgi:hypothetical protein